MVDRASVIDRAAAILRKGWVKGVTACNAAVPSSVRFCAIGAINKALLELGEYPSSSEVAALGLFDGNVGIVNTLISKNDSAKDVEEVIRYMESRK